MMATTTSTRTSYGSLRGVTEDGLVIFRGMPYARPPVGPPVRASAAAGCLDRGA